MYALCCILDGLYNYKFNIRCLLYKIYVIHVLYFCFWKDMDSRSNLSKINLEDEDICLVDSGTTNTIFRSNKYFTNLKGYKAKLNTISGPTNLIDGSGRANIILPGGTVLKINDALYSLKSLRNLLSFNDIFRNGYHIETIDEDNTEYLCITSSNMCQKRVIEKLAAISSGLYRIKQSNHIMS